MKKCNQKYSNTTYKNTDTEFICRTNERKQFNSNRNIKLPKTYN